MARLDDEFVLTGGTVRVDAEHSAAALAVRAGRVLAVGSEDEVRSVADRASRRLDLEGRTVVAGFIDAHVHPVLAGLGLGRCSLEGARDGADAVARVGEYARAHPELTWIMGSGWALEWFADGTPSRHLLDTVVAERPVLLINQDGHGAWANSAALARAGIDASTSDPRDGRIEREPDGSPQGTLHEGAVMLVARLQPEPTEDEILNALLLAQQYLHSLGVTGWQDALLGVYGSWPDPLPGYLRAASEDALTARVVGALWWDRERGLEQIEDLLTRSRHAYRCTIGSFRTGSVKMMLDGVAESFTADLLEPYLDACGCATGNTGLSYIPPEVLTAAVTRLDAADLQIHFHTLGDGAARRALDALQAARAGNGDRDNRHHLAHLQVLHPADIPRFGQLGASANIQALWAAHEPQMDELTIPFLGPERSLRQYPFASLLAAGAHVCAGSDWPVSTPDPFEAMHVAVNRRLAGSDASSAAFIAQEAITAQQFLAAYTAGSAWINHAEDTTGSLHTGKVADFAVLDGDPLTVAPERIGAISVTETYVSGRQVFTT